MINYKPRQILVTGGAGFIGCNFISYLLNKDPLINIINLDLLTYAGLTENLKNLLNETRHIFIQGDICDRKLIDNLLSKYVIDTVIHFAAESHVDRSISGPTAFIKTNIMGTFNLLEAVRHYWLEEKKWDASCCRFHHVSTDEVYGSLKKDDAPFTELTPYAPNSPYSASKASSDHLVRSYFYTYNVPATISNCSNNYGPYQHSEKFIPTIINACHNWRLIPVYGDGSNLRDWLYVKDHCQAIELIVRKGKIGENYNIGGNNQLSNLQVIYSICDIMDRLYPKEEKYSTLINFITDRPGHDWRYAVDYSKAYNELGWCPTTSFIKQIKKLCQL